MGEGEGRGGGGKGEGGGGRDLRLKGVSNLCHNWLEEHSNGNGIAG